LEKSNHPIIELKYLKEYHYLHQILSARMKQQKPFYFDEE